MIAYGPISTFPVPLDISPNLCGACDGLLESTLPDIYDLLGSELDLLWQAFDTRTLSDLSLPDCLSEQLTRELVFPDDPLTCLLSTSISRFACACNSDVDFARILDHFTTEASTALSRHIALKAPFADSRTPPGPPTQCVPSPGRNHLCTFRLPRPAVIQLLQAGYTFVDSALNEQEQDVLQRMGFSSSALQLLRTIWAIKPWLHAAASFVNSLRAQTAAFATFKDYVLGVFEDVPLAKVNYARNKNIFDMYFFPGPNRAATLETVGRRYHLTRERVRQVVAKVLRYIPKSPHFAHLWYAVYNAIVASGGSMHLDALVEELTRDFGWEEVPEPAFTPLHMRSSIAPCFRHPRRSPQLQWAYTT
jgi:hypothetical protein